MSTASVSYRPVLSILVLDLPALPVIGLLGAGVAVSLALGNVASSARSSRSTSPRTWPDPLYQVRHPRC
ncbi:hypothetical protein IWX81_001712 [Salinibacterium sp. CAN_S4]